MAGGRPTTYNAEIAARICELVSTHTCGLERLCKMYDDLPDKTTVNLWRFKHKEFSIRYAEAKLHQADLLAEEILDIADDSRNDWVEYLSEEEQGDGWRFNGDHVNRCRLRIDTRKWLAAKLLPKQYGDKSKDDDKKNDEKSVLEKIISGEIVINKPASQ